MDIRLSVGARVGGGCGGMDAWSSPRSTWGALRIELGGGLVVAEEWLLQVSV